MTSAMRRDVVLGAVRQERHRQIERHGNDNHHPAIWYTILGEEAGEVAKCAETMTFARELGELVDARRQAYTELIQVAAVAVAWAEHLLEVTP